MYRWIGALLIAGLATVAGAAEPEPGRTDGPEESEYGKGGYQFQREPGQIYIDGYFGAAVVDIEIEDTGAKSDATDLMYGVDVGYQVDDWIGFQLGYGYITDQKTNLFMAGVLVPYVMEPFNYFMSLEAEIFAPEVGENKFGIVPGVGVELLLNDHLSAGLRFQHDFIFSDDTISINRFTARMQFKF
jgi:hypothetical protein